MPPSLTKRSETWSCTTTWSSATSSICPPSRERSRLGARALELWRGGAGTGAEAIRQVAHRRYEYREPVPALEAFGRGTHPQHTILPVFRVHVGQDFLLYTSVRGDLRFPDERRSSGRADPNQHRAATFDALDLPGLRSGLDQYPPVIGTEREPHWRRLTLIAVLADRGNVDQLGVSERACIARGDLGAGRMRRHQRGHQQRY